MASLVTFPKRQNDRLPCNFPQPRRGSGAVIIGSCMYFWGGHTEFLFEADECCPIEEILPNSDEKFMDVYNIVLERWEQYSTSGSVPDVGEGSTMVGFNNCLYLYGGFNDGVYSGDMYKFYVDSKMWTLLEVSDGEIKPSPRYHLDSVLYQDNIFIFGGAGPFVNSLQKGAKYIPINRYNRDFKYGWNNEMFKFDINKGCWFNVHLGDERPPPCGGFSLNMVNSYQAILFGGNQLKGNVAEVYFFDFREMRWSAPFKPSLPDEVWPNGRVLHSACTLIDPHEVESLSSPNTDQQLFVAWGVGPDYKHCNDVWILNTVTVQWKKVDLDLRSRYWHNGLSYYLDGRTDVVLFGGGIRRDAKSEKHVVTDLTVLSFGVLTMKEYCLEVIRKNEAYFLPYMDIIPPHVKNMIVKHQTCVLVQ